MRRVSQESAQGRKAEEITGSGNVESGGGPREAFFEGVREVLPMLLAVAPFGAVTGLAGVTSGLSFTEAVAMSSIVNSGAAQLAALALLTQGTPLLVLLATTLIINLRYLMYSMALAPYLTGVRKRYRLLISHVLIDQTFAFATRRYSERPDAGHRLAYFLGLAAPLFSTWITGNIVGAALGAQVPSSWSLDFAIPLTFLALLMPAIKDRPAALAAIGSGIAAVLLLGLPYNLGLIVAALFGITVGLYGERRWWK